MFWVFALAFSHTRQNTWYPHFLPLSSSPLSRFFGPEPVSLGSGFQPETHLVYQDMVPGPFLIPPSFASFAFPSLLSLHFLSSLFPILSSSSLLSLPPRPPPSRWNTDSVCCSSKDFSRRLSCVLGWTARERVLVVAIEKEVG